MSFMDLRGWITRLEKEGELRRITAQVDWDRELGAITRRVLETKGPALLFENITGYTQGRCTKLFTSGLGSRARLARALGFPPDTSNAALVAHVMTKNRETIPPRRVATGPVKEVVVRGRDVDQTEFPVPKWHYLEGGRYIHTFSAIVTRDPDTRVMNVGIYRGMIGTKNTTPFLLVKGGQHWGQHFLKYTARGAPMEVACVIGWDPIMPFLAGSPIPVGVSEWDVMGAYRGEPAELVPCETVDLEVPASAEIVIEGVITDDPATYETEGPFGEFTGYVSDVPTPRPAMRITCLTHRRDPIFRGTLEGTLPGSYSENSVMSSVQRAAIAWNILTAAGIPGVRDVFVPPITNGVNIVVQITKAYQGQPKQIAAALWGSSAAQFRYKHVTVVEEDIDPSSYEQVDWAFAHRVNAGEGGIVFFPGIFGSPIDPSTPLADRDVARLGTGLWTRVLIDATRSWKFERRPEWGPQDGLRLGPLPRRDLESLLVDRAGSIAPDALRRIVEVSQGNPLFAEQLLAALDDDPSEAVPGSLRGLLTTRLDRLGPGERDVLRCASIAGMDVELDAVRVLLPEDAHPFVERHVDALERRHLLERTDTTGFRFSHALIRLAAYESMTHEDRARLHERFAEWLERESPDRPPELAQILGHHRDQAHTHRRATGTASRIQ